MGTERLGMGTERLGMGTESLVDRLVMLNLKTNHDKDNANSR